MCVISMRITFPRGLMLRPMILALLCCGISAHAQMRSSASLPETIGKDLKHVAQGTGRVLTSPLHWQGRDWARFGAVVGGTFALSFLDKEVNEFFLRNHSRTADKLADIGVEYGEPRTVVILTGSVYVAGLVAQNEWLRESAVILAGALLPSGLMQTTAKLTAGRARPHLGLGHDVFEPFRKEEAYYSFVSGHTMVALATSHVFAKRIDNPVAKVGLYGLGALAGTSRMYNEDHWLSDVVLGSALAIASVNTVAKLVERNGRENVKTGMQWRVQPYGRGAAFALMW